MSIRILIASMVGMAIVTRIKNENLRASLGIPLVAVMMFMLLSLSVSAQWIPDRQEYNVVSRGNFYTTEPDMATALATALSTLQYNGAKMHTLNVDKKDINSPLFNYFIRSNEEDMVYVVYVARTKANDYVVWFKFLPNESTDFEEEFVILEYVK
jgi:hypothetical protein